MAPAGLYHPLYCIGFGWWISCPMVNRMIFKCLGYCLHINSLDVDNMKKRNHSISYHLRIYYIRVYTYNEWNPAGKLATRGLIVVLEMGVSLSKPKIAANPSPNSRCKLLLILTLTCLVISSKVTVRSFCVPPSSCFGYGIQQLFHCLIVSSWYAKSLGRLTSTSDVKNIWKFTYIVPSMRILDFTQGNYPVSCEI